MTILATILLAGLLQAQPSPAPASIPLEDLYREAAEAIAEERWADAVAPLERIVALEPEHVPSLFNLAMALGETGDVEGAVRVYGDLLEVEPDLFEARMNLAILLERNGRSGEAVAEFGRAGDLRPGDPLPQINVARILEGLGRDAEAEQAYRQALEIDPSNGNAHAALGFLHLRSDNPEDAYRHLMAAREAGVAPLALLVALGDLASNRSELEAARDHYRLALEQAPGDADIRLRLALALRDMEEFDAAIDLLDGLDGAQAALAEAYAAAGRFAEAVPIYQKLAVAEPENPTYWFQLGRSRFESGERDAAIPALEQALRIDPERAEGWGMLAAIFIRREECLNAAVALFRALELRPEHAPTHFALATCLDKLGDIEQALVHYNKFTELDDGSDDVRSFQVRQRVRALEFRLKKKPNRR